MKYRNITILIFWAIVLLVNACTYEVLPEIEECSTPPVLNVINVEGANCGQSNGNIQVVASAGAGEYSYSIDGTVFQQESVFTDLPTGTYTITVRDANNCTGTADTIVQNIDGLNITTTATGAGCNTSDGTITINPVGGEAPYQFSIDENGFQTSNRFENLASGTHKVTAKDASGCEVIQDVTIDTGVEFSQIQNIIETNCAVSGCHAGNVSPDLRSVANIQNRAERIRIRTANKTMPPSSSSLSLSDAEIEAINCWTEDGAPIK